MHYGEREPGSVRVGGGTRQCLTTLIPELGALARQRGNGVSSVDEGASIRLKYMVSHDVAHDEGTEDQHPNR